MPLIARTIPNLVQGISQQPEILRLNSQATSQVNGFSSVVEGLKKRPNTIFLTMVIEACFFDRAICVVRCEFAMIYCVITGYIVIKC